MTTDKNGLVPASYQARHFALGEWQKWFEITKYQYDQISSMGTTLAEARPLYSAETVSHLQARVDELESVLSTVIADPTWRTNDNTLWPRLINAARLTQPKES